jgi:predicted RNase H-like HicB family nuclease
MGYVVLTGTVEQEGHMFVSICPELDIASCGDTVEHALDMLADAIDAYVGGLAEIGELEKTLQRDGVEVRQDAPESDKVSVSVPPKGALRTYIQEIPLAGVT